MCQSSCERDAGFTLIEVVVALALVTVGLTAIGSLIATTIRGTRSLDKLRTLREGTGAAQRRYRRTNMRKTTGLILTLTAAAALGFATLVQTASAQEAAAEATYRDIDCIYFHTAAAKVNGATDEEIRETVAMAAMVRHWSTVLNGMEVDLAGFRKETDTVLKLAGEKARQASK